MNYTYLYIRFKNNLNLNNVNSLNYSKRDSYGLGVLNFRIYILIIIFFLYSFNLFSQEETYNFSFRKLTYSEIFQEIESQTNYRFFYNDELLKINDKLSFQFQDQSIKVILSELLKNANLSFKIIDNQLVVITPIVNKISGEIKGSVITDRNEPLCGVNILIKGSKRGTVTNNNGEFRLNLNKASEKLIFSFVGYISKEIEVVPGETYNIILEQDLAELEQVIVIGYAEMKRSDITGAINSVAQKDIVNIKSSNIIESIQGKASGVDIERENGSVGSGINISIRGHRSLGEGGASNEPLYVIDGMPYFGDFNLNQNDIESIEILKDASSTAIYGVAGANGVILISTKKGEYGKSRIAFNVYNGFTFKQGELPYADRSYYLQKKRDFVRLLNYNKGGNYSLTDEEVDNIGFPLDKPEREYFDQNYDYNWYDHFIKDYGKVQDYNINVSGGSDNITYSTSFSFFNEKSLIQKDEFNRYTVRLNAESEINSLFNAGASFIGGISRKSLGNNFKNDLLKLTPLVPDKDSTGNYITYVTDDRINPFLLQEATTHQIDEANIFSTFYIQIKFTEKLSLKSSVNIQYQDIEDGTAEDIIEQAENYKANSDLQTTKGTSFVQNNIMMYNKSWDNHEVNILGGFEFQLNRIKKSRILANNLLTDGNYWYNPAQAQDNIIVQLKNPDDLYFMQTSLPSFIGRLHYRFKNKYIAQLTGRFDGASQLSEGNKWSFFPSASFAWKMNEEDFIKDIHVISNLKLRIGYGVVGNRNIRPYSSLPKLNSSPLYVEFGKDDEIVYYGYWPEELGNEDLTWEKTKSVNYGLDFGFFKHHLNGSVEFYNSYTFDLLQERGFPPTSGYQNGYDNIGNVSNRGFEISLNGVLVNQKNWFSSLTLLYSTNIEEITELGDGRKADLGKGWFVGQPVDVYYDYIFEGIWQEDEKELAAKYNAKPGDVKFRDRNGDFNINAEYDKDFCGSPRPDWTGGATYYLQYKNLDFSVSAYARIGQTILDETYLFWSPNGDEAGFALNYWTPENKINTMPALQPGKTIGTYPDIVQLQYTDGSYVKIKDIILGYNLPRDIVNRYQVSKVRLTVSLKNYFIFSKFFNKGRYDPELRGGIELPIPKMASFGLNVEF